MHCISDAADLNFGVIVDAGSSGSRLFVYVWPPHSGRTHELLKVRPFLDDAGLPVVSKLHSGLSSLAEAPHNATSYMRPLLDFAADRIPAEKHKETSLFIMATAGLRVLAEQWVAANCVVVLCRLKDTAVLRFFEIPRHSQRPFPASVF